MSSTVRWRAVLPFADRLRCDGLPGALTLEQWPSPFVGPVPWDGGRYTVVDSVLLSGDRVDGEMYRRAGMVNCVDVPGWAPSPEGVRGEFSGGCWGAMLRDDRVDGSIEVGQVTATWRGRRVEVMYVAYAYAYVIDHVPGSDYRANRLRAHRDRAIFDGLQGPVRLDELRDIVFDVGVVWRSPDSGPWPFFEFWGLDPELTGRATAHVERGGWPAWPWKTTADQGAA